MKINLTGLTCSIMAFLMIIAPLTAWVSMSDVLVAGYFDEDDDEDLSDIEVFYGVYP